MHSLGVAWDWAKKNRRIGYESLRLPPSRVVCSTPAEEGPPCSLLRSRVAGDAVSAAAAVAAAADTAEVSAGRKPVGSMLLATLLPYYGTGRARTGREILRLPEKTRVRLRSL